MSIHRRSAWAFTLLALVAVAPARAEVLIVNIDAKHYGYSQSPIVPPVGDAVTPISEAPGGALLQFVLPAGVYEVTNAAGQAGALYDAFKFNEAAGGATWVWNFLIANGSDGNKVLLYGDGSDVAATEAEAAANAAGYLGTLVLTAQTTLSFMIRDYAVGDNTGGVSIRIAPVAVPEPASLAMLAAGVLLSAAAVARRRARAC